MVVIMRVHVPLQKKRMHMIGHVADQGSLKLTLLLHRKSNCCKVLPATRSRKQSGCQIYRTNYGLVWRRLKIEHLPGLYEWVGSWLLLSCFISIREKCNKILFTQYLLERERESYSGWGHSGSTHSHNAERRFFDLRKELFFVSWFLRLLL